MIIVNVGFIKTVKVEGLLVQFWATVVVDCLSVQTPSHVGTGGIECVWGPGVNYHYKQPGRYSVMLKPIISQPLHGEYVC